MYTINLIANIILIVTVIYQYVVIRKQDKTIPNLLDSYKLQKEALDAMFKVVQMDISCTNFSTPKPAPKKRVAKKVTKKV